MGSRVEKPPTTPPSPPPETSKETATGSTGGDPSNTLADPDSIDGMGSEEAMDVYNGAQTAATLMQVKFAMMGLASTTASSFVNTMQKINDDAKSITDRAIR